MRERKRFFDDYIMYCPKQDKLFLARPDYAIDRHWKWFVTDGQRGKIEEHKPEMIEIGREPEQSMFQ